MIHLKHLFHFLGGIYLAISLIVLAALLVIIGTILEAATDSHLYASQWTYESLFFKILLGLFFINILVSALRRWPFKKRHIPFLITHFGLLMIIGGTMIKNWYGIQGQMTVLEGSANQHLLIPHTYALQIEKKDSCYSSISRNYPLNLKDLRFVFDPQFLPDVTGKIVSYTSHVSEKLETWIKGEWAFIKGMPPIPVQTWTHSTPLQIHPQPKWDIAVIRTENIQEAIQAAYLQDLMLQISFKENSLKPFLIPLKEALEGPLLKIDKKMLTTLHLPFSIFEGFIHPHLKIDINHPDLESVQFTLTGNQALINQLTWPKWKQSASFQVDLSRKPLILLIEDTKGDNILCAFDAHGRVHSQVFSAAHLKSVIAYDEGFAGYSVQASIPFSELELSREKKEQAARNKIQEHLRTELKSQSILVSPLALLKDACSKTGHDCASILLQLLALWHQQGTILLPSHVELDPVLKEVFYHIDWNLIPKTDRLACQWISHLIDHLTPVIERGENILEFLKDNKWPFVSHLQQIEDKQLFTTLAQQLFTVIDQLPQIDYAFSAPSYQAHLLSAYLLAYGIHYREFVYFEDKEEENFDLFKDQLKQFINQTELFSLILETPLTTYHHTHLPSSKLENNFPRLVLELKKGHQKQLISLAYDPSGIGLKWPFLKGSYTIRFQPQLISIPYRIRLRQARQINYAGSNQPYSYESDILISSNNRQFIETTLSMNQVYETWDGYRFYLAGMHTTESGIKKIQLIVNYDPAKYFLTYPGALLVALGIILLFWLQPYTKTKKN